jgi:anti-anti-sigma factor
MQPSPFPSLIEITEIDGVVVCRFTRRTFFDPDTIQLVGERLLTLVRHGGARKLLLNVDRVESMTTALTGKLLKLHHDLDQAGGHMGFCEVDPFLRRIFALSGITGEIPIYADEMSAVAAMTDAAVA